MRCPPTKQVHIMLTEGSPVHEKVVRKAVEIITDPAQIDDALFQHSIFCQTYLPYRNPGDDVTLWEQKQGNASLAIQTVKIKDPRSDEWVQVGLPYGTRARLILTHINTQAIKGQSQVIDVEEHLAGFIKTLGLTKNGRTINEIKEQIRRITASIITLGFQENNTYVPINFGIVKSFDLWFGHQDNRRIIWPNKIVLTNDYFQSLLKHAIPLDERALAALSHNAMAMDVYSWLAQRLHRISKGKTQFVAWQQLKEQFGQGFKRMDHFKVAFRDTVRIVLTQYPAARDSIREDENKGFILSFAQTPIPKKLFIFTSETPAVGSNSDSAEISDDEKHENSAD